MLIDQSDVVCHVKVGGEAMRVVTDTTVIVSPHEYE
jgi:hypothetical protein